MLDHIILTVSSVERSLAFYEAALRPLNINGNSSLDYFLNFPFPNTLGWVASPLFEAT